jgi:Phage tail sheath protein subtilisin-like domain/Phage tail sheath C-terminal domain
MATFPISPGISITETDLTTGIPAVATSTGGFAGPFNWGPVNFITPISTQVQLVNTFSEPDSNTAESFFTAWNFLTYSNDIQIVRDQAPGMLNATGAAGANVPAAAMEIDNTEIYFNGIYNTLLASNNYIARFPGALGDSITVYTFANTAAFNAIKANTNNPLFNFAGFFSFAPNTTPFVTQQTNGQVTGDELHILVVDSGGQFTGTANAVLEVYTGLSRLSDALNAFGQSNYYKEVIFSQSNYIYVAGVPSSNVIGWGNTTASMVGAGGFGNDPSANVAEFQFGNNGQQVPGLAGNTINSLALFADPAFVQINLLMTGSANATLASFAIQDIAEVRQDCVAFASAPLAADQAPGAGAAAAAIVAFGSNVAFSSYGVLDTGYKYQFDQYNDVFRYIPLNGDIAGLCARTDQTNGPWWSPAGQQRGIINNVTKLAYNPGQTDRNTIYQAGINPVVTFPSQGTMLFGDLTHLNTTSAFDHINVRRLFITIEQQISLAARASLFQFNDTFTRAQFVALITPFLRTIMGQRGISAFQVVCDTTNNTPAIINANQFVGDIYVQPAYSINFILLNFVAVAQGVSFSTVIGQAGNA